MTTEYVIYRGMPSEANRKLSISDSLELQRWILDPDSRPYESNNNNHNRLIARSASFST